MRRFFQFCGVGLFSLLVAYAALRVYVQWATYRHAVSAEARIVGPTGQPAFAQLPNPQSEERVAIGFAVFHACGLWPRHVVYSGDRVYAFAPLGRVFVLVTGGLDSYAVESRTHWKGTPHDFPFPETPSKDDWPSNIASSPSK
jgi:hypothetical protein